MAAAADDGFTTATDLADYLVGKGVPFRQAHEITGKLVALCLQKECGLADLSLSRMQDQCSAIGEDVYSFLTAGSSIKRRDIPGGTAGNQVQRAMEEAHDWLVKVSSD
jgi:argininosuccinate lyase